MCPVSASDNRKLLSSQFLKGQGQVADYHPAGPEIGSSRSAGHKMRYCLDTGWLGNAEAQTCSWERCLEPLTFPEGEEGYTVARHPDLDCSGRLGYETSDLKPVMDNEQLLTCWRNQKGKTGEDRDGKPVSCCLDHNGPLDCWLQLNSFVDLETDVTVNRSRFIFSSQSAGKYWFTVFKISPKKAFMLLSPNALTQYCDMLICGPICLH